MGQPDRSCSLALAPEQENGGPVAVYGYARVSTARQADDGESLEVQQRTITGYALMHCIASIPRGGDPRIDAPRVDI